METFINSFQFQREVANLNYWDKIIYCDIDWTIYRNSLFLDLIDILINDWYVSQNKIQTYNKLKKQWKIRKINYEDFLKYTIVEIFEKILTKLPYNYIKNVSNTIINSQWWHVFIYTFNKLKELQAQWYKVIFISGSPMLIVQAFARKFNFDVALWTFLSKNWNWNLKIEYVLANSINKSNIISYINNNINPSHIIAFGDTTWDFWMLEGANLWYAINPTEWLYEKIKLNENIIVIIERKDLILEINKTARLNINNL